MQPILRSRRMLRICCIFTIVGLLLVLANRRQPKDLCDRSTVSYERGLQMGSAMNSDPQPEYISMKNQTLEHLPESSEAYSNKSIHQPIGVKYSDGGHYFTYFEPAIARALYPREVRFGSDIENPDIVIFSIFGDEHARYSTARKIFMSGEAHADLNLSTGTILSIHCIFYTPIPRMRYFPYWVVNFAERTRHVPSSLIKIQENVNNAIDGKSQFCGFIYSHNVEGRDGIFDLLTSYKPVHSLGRAKDGLELDKGFIPNSTMSLFDLSVERYKPFKFVIAGENRQEPGYITEKIVSAMLANAIPIYWGAKDIVHHFNPRSFINANELSGSELLAKVMQLDQDDDAYKAMLEEPWFINNELPEWFSDEVQDLLFSSLKIDVKNLNDL